MIGNAILLALREIRHNLMRAALTTLGIVIGVAAVIAMVTLGSGATASVTKDIASLGRNLLVLVPGMERNRGALAQAEPFEMSDAEAIRREVSGLRAVAPTLTRSAVIVAGNRNRPTQVTGADNAFLDVRDWPLALGRQFSFSELRAGRAACILGETVRVELFGRQDPVGAQVRVGQIPCEVVGVLEAKGQSTFGQDQDDYIVMPLRTVQRRLAGNDDVNLVWLATERAQDVPRVKADIMALMRERRHLSKDAPADFDIRDMAEITRVVESTTAILTAFLSAIAAVSLLVGGIGIMNIMLVSVTERTREIGIRLAIGAREHDVLMQFLVEAVMMSALGGLVGIVIGLAGSAAATAALDIPFVFDPGIVVLAFLFSAAVGVAFGFFPARRAARLDPIEALRHE